ncbi:MAG: FeoA domain-containing protein [Candidatus Latescibacteria bacterium]|nr:FeoA domain-containing protein [Candidatus Latescibacterota bacterium]
MVIWIVILVLVLVLLWPDRGLYVRWQRRRRLLSRQAIEDALMHLHQRQHERRLASVESVASMLRIGTNDALGLVQRMEAQGLLTATGDGLRLSPDGYHWALQVVRAHRLFERYLADETEVPMEEIHARAHRLEHTLSVADLDRMDAALGHPAFDPQGDPIPTSTGEIPAMTGCSLVDWETARPAQIVHIEDEPPEVYAQIVAAGLGLGMVVTVVEATSTRLVVEADAVEHVLAPVVAANIWVHEAPQAAPGRPVERLTTLTVGEQGRVTALDPMCQGLTRRRFLDLGITPGVLIEPVMQSAFGEPTAYRVRGALIALRREQSDWIWIEAKGKEQ